MKSMKKIVKKYDIGTYLHSKIRGYATLLQEKLKNIINSFWRWSI